MERQPALWAVKIASDNADDSDGCTIGTTVGFAVAWFETKEEAEVLKNILEKLINSDAWVFVRHWNPKSEVWDDEEETE